MSLKKYWIIAALLVQSLFVAAQVTQLQDNNIRFYNRGLELFDKEKYGAAQKQFTIFLEHCKDPLLHINTEYYIATCALELHNPDAIKLFNKIIEQYPESPKAKASAFQLGRYYFRQKETSNALEQMERVDTEYLTPEELSEYYFIIGYCQFRKENYDAARRALEQTIETKNKYYFPANYYYGYICYQSGDLDKALKHFERVSTSKIYGGTVPLYITQIYYAKGQYTTLIPYADTITNKDIVNDVALIVAQSHYETGNFEKAESFFEKYKTSGKPFNRNETYRMAYSYYKNNKYEKAYPEFQKAAEGNDTLAQYACFNLADCYLQLNKKQNARLAFEKAYTLGFIDEVKSDALYNLAKLSYELAFHQIAAKQLVEYINEYPESKNNEEAKRILSELFLNTKNYKEAIPILESIKIKNNDIKTAYQKVTYYRAEELYLNNEFEEASKLFDKSANYNFDKKLYSLSHFWQGEILFKEGKYKEADSKFNVCLNYYTNEIKETKYYPLTYYNLGYCDFKQENYASAAAHFEKFRQLESFFGKQPQMYLDGCMRAADCYFKLKNYDKALAAYDYAIERNANGSDYALFQKGMIQGVINQPEDKVKTLRQIPNKFPRSGYIDDALFEIANTRLQQEDYPSAIREFEYILSEYPNSIYYRRARMSLGLIHYNKHDDEKALEQFKKVAEQYTKTTEGKEALNTIRAIYVARGESDIYFDYLKNIPDAGVTLSYQDSVSYESALSVYRNGNCAKAVQSFASYIKRFPEGFFIVPANFYKAECDYKDKQNDIAFTGYQYVLTQPRNEYSERSARMAATIQFLKKDYHLALSYYYLLEEYAQNKDNQMVAYLGELRCSYRLEKFDTAFTAARKLTAFNESTKEALVEGNLILGRIFLNNYQQPDSARGYFEYVIKETKNANAAEAKYSLAQISFLKKDWKQCEKHIFELNDNYSSYDYWVAKAFILLADVYMEKKDAFQAKATLQSIIDNYKGEDLNKIAREKLAVITAAEKAEKEANELKNKPVNQDDEE
jgi:TolA-binding protein